MNNSKQALTLNPKIKSKAAELFLLIEDHINKYSADETAEAIEREMGEFLKSSPGFRELDFGHELAKTEYENASYGLEESIRYMKDQVLADLLEVASNTKQLIEMLEANKINSIGIKCRIGMIKDADILDTLISLISYRLSSRVIKYREEIEGLREAS